MFFIKHVFPTCTSFPVYTDWLVWLAGCKLYLCCCGNKLSISNLCLYTLKRSDENLIALSPKCGNIYYLKSTFEA